MCTKPFVLTSVQRVRKYSDQLFCHQSVILAFSKLSMILLTNVKRSYVSKTAHDRLTSFSHLSTSESTLSLVYIAPTMSDEATRKALQKSIQSTVRKLRSEGKSKAEIKNATMKLKRGGHNHPNGSKHPMRAGGTSWGSESGGGGGGGSGGGGSWSSGGGGGGGGGGSSWGNDTVRVEARQSLRAA